MKDINRIKKFAKQMGMSIYVFSEPKYISAEARKKGAIKSINLFYGSSNGYGKGTWHSSLNFEIDSDGNCIGWTTEQINSFVEKTS